MITIEINSRPDGFKSIEYKINNETVALGCESSFKSAWSKVSQSLARN